MKIKPCIKCGSSDIRFYHQGYSSFNCGGGKCNKCGNESISQTLSCYPKKEDLIAVWNRGQKEDPLKVEKRKTRRLRKQIRELGKEPIA